MSHKRRDGNLGKPEVDRFWSLVQKGAENECWPWLGSTNSDGYGMFFWNGCKDGAHRIAYALLHGSVPDGMAILHTCDNPPCCNDAHLFPGTHKQNMEDAARKGRLHVPRPRRQRLTDAQVDEIEILVRSGMRQNVVAARFGVSETYITRVMNGTLRQYRSRPALERTKVT